MEIGYVSTRENDDAVHAINRRRFRNKKCRVPFEAWVKEMNVDINEAP